MLIIILGSFLFSFVIVEVIFVEEVFLLKVVEKVIIKIMLGGEVGGRYYGE